MGSVLVDKEELNVDGFSVVILHCKYENLEFLKMENLLLKGDNGEWLESYIGLTEQQADSINLDKLYEVYPIGNINKDKTDLFKDDNKISKLIFFDQHHSWNIDEKTNLDRELCIKTCKRIVNSIKEQTMQKDKTYNIENEHKIYKDILENIYKNTHKPKEILDNHQLLVFKQHIDNDTDKPCEIVGHRLLDTTQFHIAETIAKREKAFNEVEILLVGDLDKYINQDKELVKTTIENPNVSDLDEICYYRGAAEIDVYSNRSIIFEDCEEENAKNIAKDFKNQGYQCSVVTRNPRNIQMNTSRGNILIINTEKLCNVIVANDKQALNEAKQIYINEISNFKELNLNNANSKEQSKQKNKDNERGL